MPRYIAKKGTWFDEGTECTMVSDVWEVELCYCGHLDKVAVFCGLRNNKMDEESCALHEFEVL